MEGYSRLDSVLNGHTTHRLNAGFPKISILTTAGTRLLIELMLKLMRDPDNVPRIRL